MTITVLAIVLCAFLLMKTLILSKQIQWNAETIKSSDDIIERYKKLADKQQETIDLWKAHAERQDARIKRETMRADGIPLVIEINAADFCPN